MADAKNGIMSETETLPPFYKPVTPFEWQRSPERARVGSVGRDCLTAAGATRLEADKAEIYQVDDFLSSAECSALVEAIDAGCVPSELHLAHNYNDYRTSQTCDLDASHTVVAAVDARIAALLGVDSKFGEPMQGQRYQPGQHYRMHPDFFYIDQAYWPQVDAVGGQRTWTAMIYLNEPSGGGATRFPYLDLEVRPRVGRLLAWNNMDAHGAPNSWTIHQGCTVESGVKHIITKWYRERPWGTPPR
jgi:prolyl 4-hydroxylase